MAKDTENKANEKINFAALDKEHKVESSTREFSGFWLRFVSTFAIISSIFHLYTGGYRLMPAMQQRPLHIGFILFLVFLLYPAAKRSPKNKPTVLDMILALAGIASSWYLAFSYETIAMRGGMANNQDLIVGFIFCVILIEAARRTVGWPLPIMAITFTGYLFVGRMMPSVLRHGGFSIARVIDHMYMYTEGIFGIALGVSATYVYLFVLFGAFLSKSGTTELFASLALAMAGHTPGGPAKVGVMASALMGTIQGSSAANVAATGMFTIPLMKSVGYKPHFAAAVEAVASCGGQFLPPIMGASAFIMAEYLGMAYIHVAAGALLPALIYYSAVFMQVHLRAVSEGLTGVDKNKLPAVKEVLKSKGHLVLPLILLLTLMIMQYTPLFAAFWSIFAVIIISNLRQETKMGLKDIFEALDMGAKNVISTAVACGVVGFVVGSVGLSGLGMIITHNLVMLGQGVLLLTLIIAALASLVLSMGLPTTAVYIITATLVAPGLVRLGVPPMVAHLFCYYWGGVSAITPPVALAVYVGAGIAGADVMRTGFTAMRLGIAAYIVPFFFVYRPVLVMREGVHLGYILYTIVLGLVAVVAMSVVGERFIYTKLSNLKLVVLLAVIVGLIHPAYWSDIVSIAILGVILLSQRTESRRLEITPDGIPQ